MTTTRAFTALSAVFLTAIAVTGCTGQPAAQEATTAPTEALPTPIEILTPDSREDCTTTLRTESSSTPNPNRVTIDCGEKSAEVEGTFRDGYTNIYDPAAANDVEKIIVVDGEGPCVDPLRGHHMPDRARPRGTGHRVQADRATTSPHPVTGPNTHVHQLTPAPAKAPREDHIMTDESDEFGLAEDEEPTPVIVSSADAIYEELRTICHHSLPGTSIPAPVAYKVLGNLKGFESMLSQALEQFAAGLGKSLDTHDVYEWQGGDPVQSVATATDHLTSAAALAKQLGHHLAQAQNAIAGQGYRSGE